MFTVWWEQDFTEHSEVFNTLEEAINFAEFKADDTDGEAHSFWIQNDSGKMVWEEKK